MKVIGTRSQRGYSKGNLSCLPDLITYGEMTVLGHEGSTGAIVHLRGTLCQKSLTENMKKCGQAEQNRRWFESWLGPKAGGPK